MMHGRKNIKKRSSRIYFAVVSEYINATCFGHCPYPFAGSISTCWHIQHRFSLPTINGTMWICY